ncbi:MAG: outer membrane protein transport protein [Proteobacteria bacterium]|nr:outer membrane protein transport protein [Pseudomonadota bacterium]
MRQRGRPGWRDWTTVFLLAGAAAWPGGRAFAAGFAIYEQSVKGLGNAFAGGAASADDPSTIFYNPAGMTLLKGQQAAVGVHFIQTHFEFDNDGSTHALTPITGQGLTGDNGGDGGTLGIVPNAYYSANLDNGWAFGLGINAPFGLVTDWDDGWVGRYHALKSDVLTVNINPSAAYRVTRNLSVGAGFNAMYMHAELSQAVDFGTGLVAAGGVPQDPNWDGKATLKADDWAFGYNLGAIWEFTPDTRAGIHYRSRVKQELEGDADFDVPSQVQAILGALGSSQFQNTDASGDITLPDSLSFSLFHRYNPKLAVMADATWTHWATFDELVIKFDNPDQDPSVTTENWKNTWRLALGATYNPIPEWPLRLGVAYDESPVPDPEHRTPRLPDNDRLWLSLGTGYQVAEWFSFDVGYTHLFVEDAKVDKDPVGEDEPRGGLKGNFTNSGDIFSAQANFRW